MNRMTDINLVDNTLTRNTNNNNNHTAIEDSSNATSTNLSSGVSTQRASARISTPSASISAITPELYVGTLLASKDEGGEPLFPDRFDYLMLNFNDRVTTSLTEPAQTLADYFKIDQSTTTKEEEAESNPTCSRLLIYCGAGMSRSPALAIAWLIKVKKMPFEEAYKLVRIGRGPKFVRMNDGFMRQLREM